MQFDPNDPNNRWHKRDRKVEKRLQKPARKAAPAALAKADAIQPQDSEGSAALRPGLYLVATPIGNLGDISRRAIDILRAADVIACEDSRVTGALLHRLGIGHRAPLFPYHDHNAERARPALLERLQQGGVVALVSDAGLPLVSDPGYKMVRDCIAADIFVTAAPGPNAALTLLQLSGLPPDRFYFGGFPPPRSIARKKFFAGLKDISATLLFYETGPRLAACLADMADIFGADRDGAVGRELTKLFEEVRRGTLGGLAGLYAGEIVPKGEIALAVGGFTRGEPMRFTETDTD